MKIDYAPFYRAATATALAPWANRLYESATETIAGQGGGHGDWQRWQAALDALPVLPLSSVDVAADTIRAGTPDDCDGSTRELLRQILMELHPWRKGPYEIGGLKIDTEWRSDWKWNRLKNAICPLRGRLVLDIGCGSGYHTWRMAGEGAALAVGIDPYMIFVMQYWAMRHFLGDFPAFVLPLGIEAFPVATRSFDTVFSMGVLYHRQSPHEHLSMLREQLRPGGEAVIESLVIAGGSGDVLLPEGRYAKMRNVWSIPSVATLIDWLRECGFVNVRCIDVSPTTMAEQRATDWMCWESLRDFLDPNDHLLTCEGYPAPCRAIVLAEA